MGHSSIGQLSSLTLIPEDIHLEPHHLVPANLQDRSPANISLLPSPSPPLTPSHHLSHIAIDVTIVPITPSTPPSAPLTLESST